ncbi:trehalose operon repressor [Pediococcus ethanolidurans]|uniref:Trehalose operon repressor n=1 Tax=Pediococcus ethanolidurans TaxID=319653 RepID=A0A0R2K5P5_9LACO|nr:trehalose operon repressor [Pediococcus ethanolidurans]KRN81508.1 GntR family transcriptional regulator [Pediococcus ethanolidurans]MBU7555834.1 trehalose operon repressor [Pediococcus ethanolidurans]MBU7563195.1 trehalose operon repressor [Pediococcus ethanolidurans]MCT4397156.1 trehalose operon repressor [Pediococcus ethanolidurans]MCV3315917.1 trehalose operon repressor [Pediococcus ethanolidurans]
MRNKYSAIYHDLADKIIHHIYPVGSYLPSETQLAQLYGTSRETIRKALSALLTNGFIQKIRGKGSVVLNLQRFNFPVSGITSFKELNQSQHMNSSTKVLCIEDQYVPLEKFDYQSDSDLAATYVERLRIVNDEPIVLDRDYILKDCVSKIPYEVAADSLYAYFEGKLGLKISYATKTITVEHPTKEETQLLALEPHQDVVVVRSQTYLEDTTLFQFTESIHRPDKFNFVDFARRQKIN